jgi:hypothetical protein
MTDLQTSRAAPCPRAQDIDHYVGHRIRREHDSATLGGGCQANGAVEAARLALATLARRHGPMA